MRVVPARRDVVAATALLSLGGCGTDGTDTLAAWAGTMTDSAGVTVVANPPQGQWAEGEGWTVREELRIGSFAADANEQFGQIGGIAVNSRGEILVMDRQLRQVRFFSPEGAFVRAVGAPGEGPGEFGAGANDLFVNPDDSFLVPDNRNRRVHHFGPSGELLGSATLDMERYRALRYRANSRTLAVAAQLRPTDVLVDDASDTRDEVRRLGPDGALGGVLLEIPSGDLLGPNVIRYFTPEPTWSLTDSSTVMYAINNEYAIRSFDREGRLRRIVRRSFEPRPINDRDIRAFFAYLDAAWLAAGVPESRLAANHARVSFAEVFPAFYRFELGPNGSLWVQPIQPPGELSDADIERYDFIEDFGAAGWEVFDRDGRYLGVVHMPRRFQPRIFRDEGIYGVIRDEIDVPYVVRLRIVGDDWGRPPN